MGIFYSSVVSFSRQESATRLASLIAASKSTLANLKVIKAKEAPGTRERLRQMIKQSKDTLVRVGRAELAWWIL